MHQIDYPIPFWRAWPSIIPNITIHNFKTNKHCTAFVEYIYLHTHPSKLRIRTNYVIFVSRTTRMSIKTDANWQAVTVSNHRQSEKPVLHRICISTGADLLTLYPQQVSRLIYNITKRSTFLSIIAVQKY